MSKHYFKLINLEKFIKNSNLLNPRKKNYGAYLIDLLERAQESYRNKNIAKANRLCDEFSNQTKNFYFGHLLKISFLIDSLEPYKVLKELEKIDSALISIDEERIFFHFLKSILLFTQLDIDEARDESKKIIAIDKKYYLAYLIIAQCYAIREIHSLAIINYKISLKSKYRVDEIKANLAYSYLRNRDIIKSYRLYKKVAFKFPNNWKVQYNTALAFKRLKKYKASIKYFNRAIELAEDEHMLKLTRGRVFMRIKKYEKAENDLIIAKDNYVNYAKELLDINTSLKLKEINAKEGERRIKRLLSN